MAKLKMKRMEIIALQEERKNIVERLQRREILQFEEVSDPALVKLNTSSNISQFEKYIESASQAREILAGRVIRKKGLLSGFEGRREIEKGDFSRFIEKSGYYIKLCYDIIEANKTIEQNIMQIARMEASEKNLAKWLSLDISLGHRGTRATRCFIGSFPAPVSPETISKHMEEGGAEEVFVEIVDSSKFYTSAVIFAHNDSAAKAEAVLRAMEFVPVSDELSDYPSKIREELLKEISSLRDQIGEKQRFLDQSAEQFENIEVLIDYLIMRREKYLALAKVGQTQKAFLISGYIPEKCAEKCVKELEGRYTVAVTLFDPGEDEEVPVALENKRVVAAVEPIIETFSLPGKNDPDPSPVVAFFYYLFFGMMLSDAGYGVVLAIISLLVLRKRNIEASTRKTFSMFFYCSLSTIFWGALFGSWFGDIIPVICTEFLGKPAPNLALWYEPMSDPMKLLVLSFVLGIVHLFSGVALKIKASWQAGDKVGAILDNVPTYFLITGGAILGGQMLIPVNPVLSQIASYLAIAGIILVILTAGRGSKGIVGKIGGGLYGVYGLASGYLSDILSYSRLLALGLATGNIAAVVNIIGTMVSHPLAKVVVMIPVFIFGHSLNIGINLLGSYVHTNRLQFVELFSKFYEGGGVPFKPLKLNTKYIKFKENF